MQLLSTFVVVASFASMFALATPAPINIDKCSNIKVATCCAGYAKSGDCCKNPGDFNC
ncbi:hypothetical protein CGMCC3_g8952 [Colletotrichum fructicola]|uniref:Uncharacterized protein n=1 Tax=Colletotrichum chrysophilum TaxID=1836956 RepID=A0AAD9E9D4_9PEZI|nr:uncharacterized protein CGMCC3_g8952 [Colletotrichum fructicola]KAE9574993.1 hypothetical protein CGMCC3_g8952 [Colletotrichum fructicola]KAK1842684.1 hypothetical protein CCHR01_14691 [Colletotrichum chrysophilum]